MAAKKVISRKNLPASIPLISTAVTWLVLDRLQAAGWVYGVMGTVLALAWIGAIVGMCTEKQTDVL